MKKDNIIGIVKDSNFNLKVKPLKNPEIRYASRGIIFNDKGEIAVFNKKNKNEYKLPGGGIEEKEDKIEAFKREVLEETGCLVEITNYLGIIIEEKSLTNFKQISYVYVAKVIKNLNKLNLTLKEQEEGATLLWKDLNKALNLITNCQRELVVSKYDNLYKSLFMVERDKKILEYYLKNKNLEKDIKYK